MEDEIKEEKLHEYLANICIKAIQDLSESKEIEIKSIPGIWMTSILKKIKDKEWRRSATA